MKELNEVSFAISLNDSILRIKKNCIFKLVSDKDKFYIADFNDNRNEILPININDDAECFLANLPCNYSYIDYIDKKNGFAMIVSRRIFGIKEDIEQFSIYYEEERPDIEIFDTIDINSSGIILLIHTRDSNEEKILVESGHLNKAYEIKKQIEYDSLNNNEEKTLFIISKEKRIKKDNYQLYLLVGNIKLTNKKEYLSNKDKLVLFNMQADVQNYLNLWNEYNEIEFDNSFIKFKEKGNIIFNELRIENGIKIFFDDENFKKINDFDGQMCILGSSKVDELSKVNDFKQYNQIEKGLLDNNLITIVSLGDRNDKERSIRVNSMDPDFFLRFDSNMGYICLSLLGDKISYTRRELAKTRIITGRAGLQKMHTWFTDNPEPSQKQKHLNIDETLLTQKNLTSNQREAIDIICNTPDIAIIQGPPGTGKTTVIKEALIQINAQKENKYDFGNNLLSGFRHETVKNLTESIDLFGLPAIKIGDSEKDFVSKEQIEPRIAKFVNELIEKLKRKYNDLTIKDDEYIEFKKKYFNYVLFDNSIDSSIEILEGIKDLEFFKYNSLVLDKIDTMIFSLEKQNHKRSYEEKLFLDFLYSLPINYEALNDDKNRIETGIITFEDYFKEECELIKDVYSNEIFDIKKVRKVRKELILKYRELPDFLIPKGKKDEICTYLKELFDELRIERTKKFGGDDIAILDYIDSLTENPYLIRETLIDYTKVLGATNQHSISKNMYTIKDDHVMFDNVFVDEAATSSPLDLFIPMSIAKKKIILVGDHKQLPNIISKEILDEIEKNEKIQKNMNNDISSEMKKPLFEILMSKAYELEKKDGIKRVITLDTQFRMHPNLGELVSSLFYDNKIKSIRPASDFNHNYHDLNNKCLYWLNIPYNEKLDIQNYRIKGSTSRLNIPEAKKIAIHIKEAIDSSNYTNKLSIGVITIFKDQVQAIKNELKNIGVFDENFQMALKYEDQELLIGTVDAFQGREFDVVYLSLVYVHSENTNYSRLARENSMNLLNVALSRQKRLLIIVGDVSIYYNSDAKDKVKPIYTLAELCLREGMYE